MSPRILNYCFKNSDAKEFFDTLSHKETWPHIMGGAKLAPIS